MNTARATLRAATIAATLAALGWTGRGAIRSHRRARDADTAFHLATEQTRELARLRSLLPSGGESHAAPAPELPQRITAVLAGCGLPSSTLSSFSADATARAGPGERPRGRVTIVLAGATLPQVGGFLSAWRGAEPNWEAASIELTPAPRLSSEPPAGPGGGDAPLRAVIVLESMMLASRAPGDHG